MMSLLSFMVGQPLIRVIADAAGGGIPMLRSHGCFGMCWGGHRDMAFVGFLSRSSTFK